MPTPQGGIWCYMGFPALYRQRRPRSPGLWQALDTRFEEFQAVYDERFETRLGPLRPVVIKRVQEYLQCGILDYGFARVRCPECKHEYLVAFSCKARGFCPSCQSKRQAEFAAFLTEDVLAPVPHRQVVLSVPRRLRPYFFHHRTLLSKLARCGYETVRDLIREALGMPACAPGAVVSVQTFGSLLDFHPHLHMLATWGGFDKSGTFHPVESVPSEDTVSRLFRHNVLKMLLREGAIGEEIVENMLSWNHTGFGADIGPALASDVSADRPTRTRLETLPAYMVRAPVAAGRISEEEDGSVIYKAIRIHPRHGADSRRFDPLDFIAQIVLHIPDVHEKTVIYYGRYSNRTRARRAKQDQAGAPATHAPAGEPSSPWPSGARGRP
ncbi:MAG: transposase [Candidatus Latescibacterota bacterium]